MSDPTQSQRTDLRAVAVAEAAAWRVHLFEVGVESSMAFEAWLEASPLHREAWEEVQAPWRHIGEQAAAPELIALRRDALTRARESARGRVGVRWPRVWAGVVAAGLLLVLGVQWTVRQPEVYRTAFGERRVVMLQDGSRVTLDSGTLLRVSLSTDRRALELVEGQARFDVAHDAMRPFVVSARDRRIVALGTAFTVDLLGSGVVVTLLTGRVSVVRESDAGPSGLLLGRNAKHAEPPVSLRPGDQLSAAAEAPVAVRRPDLSRVTAWEQGRLVFDDQPLAVVAEQVTRHARDQSVRADPDVADLRLSGVFEAGDVATFVDTVTRYLPVRADTGEDAEVVLRRAR
jgi:transmembrane sensor